MAAENTQNRRKTHNASEILLKDFDNFNFGPNLRYKSTQKQKSLLSNIIVVVFVVESVNS